MERVRAEVPEDLPPEPGTGNGQVALGAEEAPLTWGSSDHPSLPVLVRNEQNKLLLPTPFSFYDAVSFVCPLPPVFIKSSFPLAKQLSVAEAPPGRPRQPPSPGKIFTVTADGPTGEAAWGSGWAGRAASVSGEGQAAEGLVPAPHPESAFLGICLSVRGGRSLAHGGHHAGWVGVAEGQAGGGVDGRWGGQDVSRVAEGWEVAHRRHVSGQGSRAEGGRLLLHALGQLLKALGPLLVLLGLVGHLPVPSLDAFLLHGQRPVHLGATTELSVGGAPFREREPHPQLARGAPLPKAHRPPRSSHQHRCHLEKGAFHRVGLPGSLQGVWPAKCQRRPPHRATPPNPTPKPRYRFPRPTGPCPSHPPSQLAPLVGSPSGAQGSFPSQATLEIAAEASPGSTKRSGPPGGGAGQAGRTHIVQLVVEATGVADRVPVGVSAP